MEKGMENKGVDQFRQFGDGEGTCAVTRFYREQHLKQTYAFALSMQAKYAKPVGKVLSVWDALDLLDKLVDQSDPDLEGSQLQHALQAAEAARKLYPEEKDDWMVLVALIHDLGKMLAVDGEPQWAVVGDTFPVGCAFDPENVYHSFFRNNPDSTHPVYSTKNGLYKQGVGFRNVIFSWGHDEYLYRVLKRSKTNLPEVALHVIRFHSFYPWHTKGAYAHLADQQDREFLPWLKAFQKCDLYSKSSKPVDLTTVKPFYTAIIQKYLSHPLLF
jgi:inositol oxygenase